MIVSQYYYLPRRRKQQKRVLVSVAMILHNIITGTLEVDDEPRGSMGGINGTSRNNVKSKRGIIVERN
jgi:hypothetical protein